VRLRRSAYVFFYGYEGEEPNLAALLRGRAELVRTKRLVAMSVLTGAESTLSRVELDAVLSVPSDRWVGSETLAEEVDAARLVDRGLLLTDDDSGPGAELRAREERLRKAEWNLYGALFYFLTKWRGIDLRRSASDEGPVAELPVVDAETVARYVAHYGPPPPAFKEVEPLEIRELPLLRGEGGLYDALSRRRTTRGFDPQRALPLEELALVCYEVFGCHGYAPIAGDHVGLRKTSPSGGGLHPTEAYPIVSRVAGLEPGIYHYSVRRHELELLERLDADEATELASTFAAGQTYFGQAHVTFVLIARFERTFWKYRRNQRALAAIYMDAAHLSQTLYLVCAERGLGAWVTAAINGADIEERLGLDGVTEGAIALAGCGIRPRPERSALEPQFRPYVPRETAV
jgi:putative peptide maturation dehydrogenase